MVRVSSKQRDRRVFGNRKSVKEMRSDTFRVASHRPPMQMHAGFIWIEFVRFFNYFVMHFQYSASRFASLPSSRRVGEFLSGSEKSLIAVCGLEIVITMAITLFWLLPACNYSVITMRWKIVNNFQRQSPWFDYTPDMARAKNGIE